jgi:pimeloyl-ACP methyl ester carboxylesterase
MAARSRYNGGMRRSVALSAALAAGVLGGATYWAYRSALHAAQARVAAGSQIAATPCGPIEYALAGDGPPILFVHGAGGGFDQGLLFGAPLASRGFRVIAVSRFGYLRTPLPADASAAAQADAHACLLDALQIDRATVIGGSAGAPSALQLAIRHPDRVAALVLLVPAAYTPRPDAAPPLRTPAGTALLFDTALRSDFLFWAAIRMARTTLIRAVLATPPEVVAGAPASEQARVAAALDQILPVSRRRLGLLNDAAVTSSLPRYELERIVAPTLVASAADDLFGTYEAAQYTAEHVPNAAFIGYPTGGHLWVGRQQELMSEIEAFLR